MKNKKKFVISAILTIFLGFIAEKFLNPVLEIGYSYFLKIGSLFIKSFSDSVYQSISDGFSKEPYLRFTFLLIIMFVLGMTTVYLQFCNYYHSRMDKLIKLHSNINSPTCEHSKNTDDSSQSPLPPVENNKQEENTSSIKIKTLSEKIYEEACVLRKNFKKITTIFTIYGFFVSFFSLFIYGKQVFINSSITKTLSNIEIVSPYISETEYKSLKSDFYSIEDKKDYDLLNKNIAKIASDNSITLK